MAILTACIGTDEKTWQPVLKLATMQEWEKVFFICPEEVTKILEPKENHTIITIDDKKTINEQIKQISEKISASAFGEVGVSIYSGTGLSHMILLAALLKTGCGIKLVHFDKDYFEL